MTTPIHIRPAIDEDDRRRLREFIGATQGARGLLILDIHLARARYRTDFTLLIERDGVLIGSALLRHIRLRLGGALIEAAEIEHLIIHQAHEQMVLHELVDVMLQICLEQGLVLLLLHAQAEPYLSMGFAPYSTHSLLSFEPLLPQTSAVHHRVEFALRPLNERLDKPADLGSLYELSQAGLALSEERKRTDWRGWPGIGMQALVFEDRHEASVGYVVMESISNQGMLVSEAALANIVYAEALLRLLREFVYARSLPRLILNLPHKHALIRAGRQLGGQVLEAHVALAMAERPLALCGMVDVSAFLEQLMPELERRLHLSTYAGWRGTLMVRLDGDGATLHIEASHVHIEEIAAQATCELDALSLGALTQLLLGIRAAADLHAAGELRYAERYAGLIAVLFPYQGLETSQNTTDQ